MLDAAESGLKHFKINLLAFYNAKLSNWMQTKYSY